MIFCDFTHNLQIYCFNSKREKRKRRASTWAMAWPSPLAQKAHAADSGPAAGEPMWAPQLQTFSNKI
jgi:hypothetical protein